MSKRIKANNKDFWMFKVPINLKIELNKVRKERIKKGKEEIFKPVTFERLGLAISRHKKLLNDLIIADFIGDDKDE